MSSAASAHRRTTRAAALAVLVLGLLLLLVPSGQAQSTTVLRTSATGPITPVTVDHLADAIERARVEGHEALVIHLDTPGGGLDPTRTIVQALLDAPVPVIVYVSPSGADAGSAGTFITLAAHVAAMAPGTTIGAATPVDLEGQEVGDKVVQNTIAFAEAIAEERGRDTEFAIASVRDGLSVTSSTAVESGAVDLVAGDTTTLLEEVDGREVEVRGSTVTLNTAGAGLVEHEMSALRRLLQALANPNLAFILLSLGTVAILYEIANPGLGLGGVVGAASLIVAMFSLSVLPVNIAGLLLLLLAAAMFIAELFMPGVGVGAAGGTAALLLGGLFLFQAPTGIGVDWWVLIPTAVVAFGATALAGVFAVRTRHIKPVKGSDDLLGHVAVVERSRGEYAQAQIYGSYWRIRPADPGVVLRDGERVRVVERRNIDLLVEPVTAPDQPPPTAPQSSGQSEP